MTIFLPPSFLVDSYLEVASDAHYQRIAGMLHIHRLNNVLHGCEFHALKWSVRKAKERLEDLGQVSHDWVAALKCFALIGHH